MTTRLVLAFMTSSTRLLQLSAGRPPARNARAAAVCSKRSCALILDLNQWDRVTPGLRQSYTLVANMLAYQVQVVFYDAGR